MTAAEWPAVDSMPNIVSSNDIFDSEILGDELMDIYNTAVTNDADEISSILNGADDTGAPSSNPMPPSLSTDVIQDNLSTDDGLGAFRPSTSFNDLSTLLTSEGQTTSGGKNGGSAVAPVASSKKGSESKGKSNKRKASGAGPAPAAKRKTAAARKPAGGSKAKSSASKVSSSASSKASSQSSKSAGSSVARVEIQPKATASSGTVPSSVNPATAPSSTDIAPAPAATEADFKSVAQAAVASLLVNGSKPDTKGQDSEDVDTSSEHIKALTGSNWVAVCGGGDGMSAADKANNRARRQNLTADERARQNRDRNREHARNTRLRKKAYVEELKRTLLEMVSQRESSELEKRQSVQRDLEQREVRFRVIEEFLKLRGRNEPDPARWAAILENSFSLTIPPADFRRTQASMHPHEQVLKGVSAVMADSGYFSAFLQTLGNSQVPSMDRVVFNYNCNRKNFIMDKCTAVLEWTAASAGAVQKGARGELALKGSVKAVFSPASNKLISATLSFDTGAISAQLGHLMTNQPAYDHHDDIAAVAAQHAASEADALLDSLQMPHLDSSVPPNVTVVPESSCSEASSVKGDCSDDDLLGHHTNVA